MGRVIKFSATIEISGCVLGYLGTVVANVDQGNEPLRPRDYTAYRDESNLRLILDNNIEGIVVVSRGGDFFFFSCNPWKSDRFERIKSFGDEFYYFSFFF